MKKFNDKYRIPSARLPHWDYSMAGTYFITICTHNKIHFLGDCQGGKMVLSTVGAIVQGFWYEIPKHFPLVELGAFVVMPNHIHGILILSPPSHIPIDTDKDTDKGKDKSEFYQRISPQAGSVSTIVRSFKSVCTKHIRQAFPDLNFGWQTRFWDTIIVNDLSFDNISTYIRENPQRWDKDKFFNPPP